MYTFLYLKYYRFLELKKANDPTFNTSCIVFITQGIHFIFILTLLGKLFQFKIPSMSNDGFSNKMLFLPIAILWLYLVHKFYSSKLKNENLEKVSNQKELNYPLFFILIFITILIPLYLTIILSGGQIWK